MASNLDNELGVNLSSARVVCDSAYSPARHYIEDGSGRLARKKCSHRATHAALRYWLTHEAAQATLDKVKAK